MGHEENLFLLIVHHGGYIKKSPIEYLGGKLERIVDIDIDKWSFQELRAFMKSLNYMHECRYFWHPSDEDRLVELRDDDDVMLLGYTTIDGGYECARVYVEHINEGTGIGNVNNLANVADEVDCERDSDESDESYHPIAESDEDPDDDEFEKYTDILGGETVLNVGTTSSASQQRENFGKEKQYVQNVGEEHEHDNDFDKDYESDNIDLYASDSEDDGDYHIRRIKYEKCMMRVDFMFEVGMEFITLAEFKEAIRDWNVLNGRSVKFAKNDRERVRGVCKDPNCGWLVFISSIGKIKTFLIKSVNMKHTCQFVYNNKCANTNWVMKTIMDDISRDPKYKLKNIVKKIEKDANLGISISKAQRAKKRALEILMGTHKEQFAKLWSYLEEMKRVNIENTARMKVDIVLLSPRPLFQRVYICLDACRKGFLAACRPFIGVDGCFLTGDYGGQLLTAVGLDPNNQYFPLAWAIVEVENTESWRWFIDLLLNDIGPMSIHKWIFISDQQKGLMTVFDELLEGVEHRFCLRHLYNNFRKKWPGRDYCLLLESAARAPYEALHLKAMEEIKKLSVDAYQWLMRIPKTGWCRHAFSSHPLVDNLLNNECESFNGRLIPGRDQGPIGLLEFIRCYVMDKFVENRIKVSRYQAKIMPKIKTKLEKRITSSRDWVARAAGYHKWEVSNAYGKRHVVDLEAHLCSCNSFQLCGIPCPHAVKAIHCEGDDLEDYVSPKYSREAYVTCYASQFSALNGEQQWPDTTYPPPLPPPFQKKPGRPKKLRRRDPNESQCTQAGSVRKLTRKSLPVRCGNCGNLGHNRRSCSFGCENNDRD